jgi:hypothetical protein
LIHYTERLTLLVSDIVERVPDLSFIDPADLLVFARFGRANAEGAFATCHCLTLPQSDPGYYFWRDRASQRVTRRSEWFVTRSPIVSIGQRTIKYMLSFSLPRFCNQTLDRSRKGHLYDDAEPWVAKLDTVVHELFHIDPELSGIRKLPREDGTVSPYCHSPRFFEQVSRLVHTYLDSRPDEAAVSFLRDDFDGLIERHGGVVGTAFRSFPSFPQRYVERLQEQRPCDVDGEGVHVEPLGPIQQQIRYTEDDLHVRHFTNSTSRRLIRKGAFRAA